MGGRVSRAMTRARWEGQRVGGGVDWPVRRWEAPTWGWNSGLADVVMRRRARLTTSIVRMGGEGKERALGWTEEADRERNGAAVFLRRVEDL